MIVVVSSHTQGVLWPVFHHVVDVYGDLVMRFFTQDTLADLWQCYTNVNRRFRDKIVEVGDFQKSLAVPNVTPDVTV